MNNQDLISNGAAKTKLSEADLEPDWDSRKRPHEVHNDKDVTECCDICQQMIGTLRGLQELVVYGEGYEHNNRYEL
jgi:hypothetical protein